MIKTNGYSGIQSTKSQYRNRDRRNTRSGINLRSAKDDASGVEQPDEVGDKVRDILFLGPTKSA